MHTQSGVAELCGQTNAGNGITPAQNYCQVLTGRIHILENAKSSRDTGASIETILLFSLGIRVSKGSGDDLEMLGSKGFLTC